MSLNSTVNTKLIVVTAGDRIVKESWKSYQRIELNHEKDNFWKLPRNKIMILTAKEEAVVQEILKKLEPLVNGTKQLNASDPDSRNDEAIQTARQKRAERIRANGKKLMER
jgi:hypothetical protein